MRTLRDNEIHIWSATSALPDAAALAVLSADEHARAARFVFDADRWRHLTARCLVRQVLSRYADLPAAAWRFEANAQGRPTVASGLTDPPLHFNLSHAGPAVVCALARFAEVGIDVEQHVPTEFREIGARYFATDERAWLAAAPDDGAASLRFLTLWTLKEAYVKARGAGLSIPLERFSVLPDDGDGATLRADAVIDGAPARWFFVRRMWLPGMPLALAARLPDGGVPAVSWLQYDATAPTAP
ncbi:MAG: 4'-phosphopantetheinyl transferase superfamily protein [Burkholderiales bacterium]|nr:4'-phosphopantetheinyl transferase superfamily protein [Burkholderiales bacterium]